MADNLPFKPDANLPDNVVETDFSDETIKGNEVASYKGRLNMTDRIGIIMPNKVVVGRAHYKQGLGYILCSSEFKLQGTTQVLHRPAPCCTLLGGEAESSIRVSVPVIQYHTKPDGVLLEPFGYTLLIWRFGDDKYEQLKNINKEWPLTDHDLTITCTEEKYQRLTINICKQSIVRGAKFQESFGKQVNEWMEFTRPKLARTIGKKITGQELMEKLGKAQSPAVVSSAMDSPISDIADLLGS